MQIIGFVEEANSTQFTFWVQGQIPSRGSLVMTHCYENAKAFGVVVGNRKERSGLVDKAAVDPHLNPKDMEELRGYLGSMVEARIVGRQVNGKIEYNLPCLPAEKGQDVLVCEEEDVNKFLEPDTGRKFSWMRHLISEPIEVISETVNRLGSALQENERRDFTIRAGKKITGLGVWSYQNMESMARILGAG